MLSTLEAKKNANAWLAQPCAAHLAHLHERIWEWAEWAVTTDVCGPANPPPAAANHDPSEHPLAGSSAPPPLHFRASSPASLELGHRPHSGHRHLPRCFSATWTCPRVLQRLLILSYLAQAQSQRKSILSLSRKRPSSLLTPAYATLINFAQHCCLGSYRQGSIVF